MLRLLRAMPPGLVTTIVVSLDTNPQAAFANWFGIERLEPNVRLQFGLPTRYGGVGVGSLGYRHHSAFLGS
eukprot:4325766-Karenia_brevis.AAC.1